MADPSEAEQLVTSWLQPLPDESAPCGADLEYDNEFLALTQAAAGKPETQFGAAEPPNWREVVSTSESLFDRTRDLRVAIYWLRGMVRLHGWPALAPGLGLVSGLLREHWDQLHPLPDPDDGDPYARVNALALLREVDGLIGDLREARVVADRAIGEITGRAVEVAFGLSPLRENESDPGKTVLSQMMAAAVAKHEGLRDQCTSAVERVLELMRLQNDRFGVGEGADLKPLRQFVEAVAALLPVETAEDEAEAGDGEAGADDGAVADGGSGGGRSRRGLSGSVTSREEAIRAIDMVCAYLEQAEPTNPAPLYLRRGRQLISHNFLQLMKVLAPDALPEVARVVGIDPDSIEPPDGT